MRGTGSRQEVSRDLRVARHKGWNAPPWPGETARPAYRKGEVAAVCNVHGSQRTQAFAAGGPVDCDRQRQWGGTVPAVEGPKTGGAGGSTLLATHILCRAAAEPSGIWTHPIEGGGERRHSKEGQSMSEQSI